jgi:hypothetical protein
MFISTGNVDSLSEASRTLFVGEIDFTDPLARFGHDISFPTSPIFQINIYKVDQSSRNMIMIHLNMKFPFSM